MSRRCLQIKEIIQVRYTEEKVKKNIYIYIYIMASYLSIFYFFPLIVGKTKYSVKSSTT